MARLARSRVDKAIARALAVQARLDAHVESVAAPEVEGRPDILSGCFPEQLAFILDESPQKAALCTRRAAKTYSVGLDFINDALDHPKADYLFLGLSREEAKRIFWKNVLQDIDSKYNLGAKFNKTTLEMALPNGATIYILGMDADETQKSKLLGGKYRKVCVDEGQAWTTDIEELIVGVLGPATTDLRGQIILTGTPGNLFLGYFKRVTNNCAAGKISPPDQREPGWSLHSWTTYQNPYMAQQWDDKIKSLIAANPKVIETPAFRQNYRGEWVVDLDARCYRFLPERNEYSALPVYKGGDWHFILGVDLGYLPDPSAIVVAAWHDWSPFLYFVRSWKQWRVDITALADKIKIVKAEVAATYGQQVEAVVIDGSAKQAVAELSNRHDIDLICADKAEKEHFIELMNAEFIMGRILLHETDCAGGLQNKGDDKIATESLAMSDEYEGLIWDPKHMTPGKRKEHPGCANHLCDCGLYAWRHAYTYISQMPGFEPSPGSDEWFKVEQARMRQSAVESVLGKGDPTEYDDNLASPASEEWETWAR
jgi:hypothetical protein